MADLVLTPERRDQLAALLADEHRLRTQFPRVAEYLTTAPMLPGTGDDAFFALLDTHWKLESTDPHHVSWWNLTDVAQAWIRR